MLLINLKEVMNYLYDIYLSAKSQKSIDKFYNFSSSLNNQNFTNAMRMSSDKLDEHFEKLYYEDNDEFAEWILSLSDSFTDDISTDIIYKILGE